MATTRTTRPSSARDFTAEVAFLTRALKAPTLRESVSRLAECGRKPGGVRLRPRPLHETRRDHASGHPGRCCRPRERGVPRTTRHRKTHLAIGLAIRACQAGHRVAFATAGEWVDRLAEAHHAGRLQPSSSGSAATRCWSSTKVGYIPFEPEAANLFFQLVYSRYERASLIVTSNKQFGRWDEVFGDDVGRRHDRPARPPRQVIALKGDSADPPVRNELIQVRHRPQRSAEIYAATDPSSGSPLSGSAGSTARQACQRRLTGASELEVPPSLGPAKK